MPAPPPTLADLLDILVVGVLIYALLRGLRRGKGGFALAGMVIFALLFLAASTLGLRLVTVLFQGFFTVLLVALVVIFQDEIRQFFEGLALWSLRRRGGAGAAGAADVLTKTAFELAGQRVGALVAVQGRIPLAGYVHGGTDLDGALSGPLLQSIFDPHSPGHDGALLLIGARATRFGCHLDLSTNEEELGARGTRHAAALGLSEQTDALCVVVSEERGTVSVARAGRLERIDEPERLRALLEPRLRPGGTGGGPTWRGVFLRHLPQKAASLVIAAVLWFFFVHESVVEYRAFSVPVKTAGLAADLELVAVEPARVEVITAAPRRTFYFVDAGDFDLTLGLFEDEAGTQEKYLTASDLSFPDGVTFVNVVPRNVRLVIRPRGR